MANSAFPSDGACGLQDVLQGEAPTSDDIDHLPFCTDVLLETLRILPPAYMIGRCAAQDTTLKAGPRPPHRGSQFSIAKGTTALVSPYLLQNSAALWGEDASDFRPARWVELREQGLAGEGWRGRACRAWPQWRILAFWRWPAQLHRHRLCSAGSVAGISCGVAAVALGACKHRCTVSTPIAIDYAATC